MYDRKLANPRPIPRPESALRYRVETLIGITGARMSKYRDTWRTAVFSILNVVWRPHLLMILLFEAAVFGFSIGINVSRTSTKPLQAWMQGGSAADAPAPADHQRRVLGFSPSSGIRVQPIRHCRRLRYPNCKAPNALLPSQSQTADLRARSLCSSEKSSAATSTIGS